MIQVGQRIHGVSFGGLLELVSIFISILITIRSKLHAQGMHAFCRANALDGSWGVRVGAGGKEDWWAISSGTMVGSPVGVNCHSMPYQKHLARLRAPPVACKSHSQHLGRALHESNSSCKEQIKSQQRVVLSTNALPVWWHN